MPALTLPVLFGGFTAISVYTVIQDHYIVVWLLSLVVEKASGEKTYTTGMGCVLDVVRGVALGGSLDWAHSQLKVYRLGDNTITPALNLYLDMGLYVVLVQERRCQPNPIPPHPARN